MTRSTRLWDVFCRVVDNYGDIGVCWRLAADLAARGEQVRLWVDDPAPLAWMAPAGAAGVQVLRWGGKVADHDADADADAADAGDVVIEAFGCDPPPAFVDRMARRAQPPVWVNLEYLSAEPYVERSHALASPQRNGLTKWFFYPGFAPATGGLLREPGLQAERAAFDRHAWLAGHGLALRPGERVVSLFCYDNSALSGLLATLGKAPTLLLATPGPAQRQVHACMQTAPLAPPLRVFDLPWLPQPEFDRLLWAADINFVRGEDSLVRSLWAGAPFVWQIYPQHDGAHAAKLGAFLAAFCKGTPPAFAASLAQLWQVWNGLAPGRPALPPAAAWSEAAQAWRSHLLQQTDATTQLIGFVAGRG